MPFDDSTQLNEEDGHDVTQKYSIFVLHAELEESMNSLWLVATWPKKSQFWENEIGLGFVVS